MQRALARRAVNNGSRRWPTRAPCGAHTEETEIKRNTYITARLGLVAGMALAAAIMPLGLSAGHGEPPTGHSSANDFPDYLTAWRAAYPSSTLPERMEAIGLSTCVVCHEPRSFGAAGTCYREDLRTRLGQGLSIADAIIAVDGLDSDGDGVANGVEILMLRRNDPTERGYHPGLIGALGTDPCASNPSAPVSNQIETPPCPCACDFDTSSGPGVCDIVDFVTFAGLFATGDPCACDLDTSSGPGVCDIVDFVTFAGQFAGGCP